MGKKDLSQSQTRLLQFNKLGVTQKVVAEQKFDVGNTGGTKAVAEKPELLCRPIVAHPRLSQHGNPLVTIVKPFPLPGTDYGINFSVQLVDVKVDFHPGNTINLPSELQPLPEQRLAFGLTVCAGVGCPPDDVVDQLIPPPPEPNTEPSPQ